MLQLFQSLFDSGRRDVASHSDELIVRATERAVDGTDPRIRALPGYQKKLRSGVAHAIDHVVTLVESLPPALDLDPRSYGTAPELTLYFASVEHLREVLERDPTLNQWRSSAAAASAGRAVMLLLMTLQERNVLGVALEGEILRHGVAQSTVSLSSHQLIDPSGAEEETRRLLKRRAFDHLLALALGRMAAVGTERAELSRERDLLRRKLTALAAGHWGFDGTGSEGPADRETLQRQLESIEAQLGELRSSAGTLQQHLDIAVDVLARAEQNFWSTQRALIVDRMGVRQSQATALAPEVGITVLCNAAGRSLVARLVSIERERLPAQRDLLRDAERYLG
jgi:hypothetical protein